MSSISVQNFSFNGDDHKELSLDPKAADPKKLKKRRYDQKTGSDTKSSKTHNSHKTSPFLLEFSK
jgi:hypothetical protein